MINPIRKLLSRNDDKEPAVRLRAWFIRYMCLFLVILVPCTLLYVTYLHLNNPLYNYSIRWILLAPGFVMLLSLILIMVMLVRDFFSLDHR